MSRRIAAALLAAVLGGCGTAYTGSTAAERERAYEVAGPAGAKDTVAPTTRPAAPVVDSKPSLNRVIRDVREAMDLDEAVDAYAAGMAINPDSAPLHRAYMHRVVELGAPQLATAAAERVLAAEPNDGLARAVLADAEAHQGNFADALTDISLAVPRAGDDPFVQVTAAHLLAWYDNNPTPPALPSYTRRSLALAHGTLGDHQAYNDAYREASAFYQDEKRQAAADKSNAAPATQPTTGPSVASTEPAPEARPDYAGYSGGGIGYVAAPYAPYWYGGYYADPVAYPWPIYYGWEPGWWAFGGFAVIDFNNFRHRHDHDHDHDRDHHHHNIDDRFRDRFFGGGSQSGGNSGGGLAFGGGRGRGTVGDVRHLDVLRNRVQGFDTGLGVRAGGFGFGGATARGLNPADPHFRGAGGRFSGGVVAGRGQQSVEERLSNLPGPLSNLPGPLSNIPPVPGEGAIPPGAFQSSVPAPNAGAGQTPAARGQSGGGASRGGGGGSAGGGARGHR